MVDYQSKYRLYASGYTAVVPRTSVPSMRELYHETGRRVFPDRRDRPVHDGRHDVAKRHTQPEDWDAWLLSHGLQATYDDIVAMNGGTPETPAKGSKNSPDKLLYVVGIRGKEKGDWEYPRGLCTTIECEIAVADSGNHRVQVLNQLGLFKLSFGKFGSGDGEFNEPTDVTELPNGDFAVADRRNKRVQVFSEEGEYRSQVPVSSEPFTLSGDAHYNLAVATVTRTIELFHDLAHVRTFPVPARKPSKKGAPCPLHIGLSDSEEIVISDPVDRNIKVFNFEGQLLRQFPPTQHAENLSFAPGGISVTQLGQVLVNDTLNHSVSLLTTSGTLLKQVLTPGDQLGTMHSLAVGPEGHLVASHCSIQGEHCVKIFRYRQCPCHEGKTGSSKKRTPATSPDS